MTQAQPAPKDDGLFYYTIGGGAPILPPASTGTETVTIGASVAWGSNLTCGAFDPFVTVSNQLNGVTEGFQRMMSDVLQAATAAVASLPGLILQRANPGLYDLMQNGILQAKADLQFAKTSCEEISRALASKLPADDWTLVSTGQSWRQRAAAGADIIEAKQDVDANAGDARRSLDVRRTARRRRAAADSVNADTVIAGYNVLLNRGALRDGCSARFAGRLTSRRAMGNARRSRRVRGRRARRYGDSNVPGVRACARHAGQGPRVRPGGYESERRDGVRGARERRRPRRRPIS